MLFSFSDPTDSVPVYLLLLNLLFIFLLCCPHSLHCLTWSSPLSTIKSCCHQGDFSILGTTAGSRLCLAPHSFPNWLHYCCEKPMHKLVWLLRRLHLLPALASKLLSWYFSFCYFMYDILCWTSCSGVTGHALHCMYSIIFTCFSFHPLPWSLLPFKIYSVVSAHKLSLWDGIYLYGKWFPCHEYYKESQADLPVFCYPELKAFSGTLH